MTKAWKVYSKSGNWVAARESSKTYDFSGRYGRGLCIIELLCSDLTETYEYIAIVITADDAECCKKEFFGQLYDGIFENSGIERYEEVLADDLIEAIVGDVSGYIEPAAAAYDAYMPEHIPSEDDLTGLAKAYMEAYKSDLRSKGLTSLILWNDFDTDASMAKWEVKVDKSFFPGL